MCYSKKYDRNKYKHHMIQRLIHTILKRRHFWRYATFSEVAEIYMASILRTIAISLGAVFMSVYLFKAGYSIVSISLFWAAYFAAKSLVILPLAQLVALIGIKRSILISNLLYIPSIACFMVLGELGWWALIGTALFQSVSAGLYDVAYLVGFSRVKSLECAGRQVATMQMFEKLARGISPLVAGMLALWIDPLAPIALSAVFLAFGAWPLLRSAETMTTGFWLAPKGFPWSTALRSLLVQLPLGIDLYASDRAWSLFLVSLIFVAEENQAYVAIGALASLVLLISLAAARMFGQLIDRRAGNQLLLWMALGDAAVHLARALTHTPMMAIGTNAAGEVVRTGYGMAFMRGMFDVADRSGYRVFYIGLSQLLLNVGVALAALLLAGLMLLLDSHYGFSAFYLLVAGLVIFLSLARFRVYAPR